MIEPKSMQEIHDIRIKLAEESKDLSAADHARLVNERVETALKQLGIELPKGNPAPPRTQQRIA
jgi:hypothetical protein